MSFSFKSLQIIQYESSVLTNTEALETGESGRMIVANHVLVAPQDIGTRAHTVIKITTIEHSVFNGM